MSAPIGPKGSKEETSSSANQKMSSQMEAALRVMNGQGERTIAEKFADQNRPTWDAYKKANEEKLNMDGMDQRKMEEYRKELDAQRDKILSRGTNHKKKKKKRSYSSDEDSSSEDSRRRRRRKKKKRKKKEKEEESSHDTDSRSSRERRHARKKKKKRRREKEREGSSKDEDHYRLSSFFKK